MTAEKIIHDLQKQAFKPVYWLEGEEEFFIDQVMQFAEHKILKEEESSFNLSVFYGRDAAWADVMNACRRYPMFAEKQVVLLKEAQHMKDIDKLEAYIEKPLPSTLLFIGYKNKKVDGRTKLARLLKDKAVLYSTKKMYDNQLPEWVAELTASKGFTIQRKAMMLLIDHIGNDLSRLNNEIDKLALNLNSRKNISEEDIENFVGISKEFNVFELQQAIATKDMYKAMRIVQYFESNPKAAPLQLVFPSLYNFFSKVLVVHKLPTQGEKAVASVLGVNAFFVKDYTQAATRFSYTDIEKILLLLYEYNLRNIGINDADTSEAGLLKEMIVKMIA